MRTENQVKRKINELMLRKQTLESAGAEQAKAQIERIEEQIMLLEWVLNEASGSYHQ